MDTENTTELVNTLELRSGDTVWTHGMRIRLGARGERHSPIEGLAVPLVVWFHGTVMNFADLDGSTLVPRVYRTDSRCTECAAGEHWQVQGNERARWHREIKAAA